MNAYLELVKMGKDQGLSLVVGKRTGHHDSDRPYVLVLASDPDKEKLEAMEIQNWKEKIQWDDEVQWLEQFLEKKMAVFERY